MRVYVLSKENKPLMSCEPVIARLLLKEGKAKVARRTPFTIKLTYKSKEYTQDLSLGLDPGSKVLGTAVRRTGTNKIVYGSEVELRTDVKRKMDRRRMYRRMRRNRKTRYRECRFNNRARREGWLPPSVQSKVDSTKKEVRFIFSILPITRVVFEYSKFDIHKLTNPKVWGYWYQLGPKFQYENTKAYVLHRDGYKCQFCKGKSKDPRLECHHVKPRGKGGTDKPTNQLTLCSTCHEKVHSGEITLAERQLKTCKNTRDATQVSIISKRIFEFLVRGAKKRGFKLVKTYGYLTKVKRRLLVLGKTHVKDAIAASYPKRDGYKKELRIPVGRSNFYRKICVAKGDYRQTMGKRSEKKIVAKGRYKGFRKFDVVKYLGKVYSIRGMMASGYVTLMDSTFKQVKLLPIPKFGKLVRISTRKSCIVLRVPPILLHTLRPVEP